MRVFMRVFVRVVKALGGAAFLVAVGLTAGGCSSGPEAPSTTALTMWTHGGTAGEQSVLARQVAAWDEANAAATVDLQVVPEGEYTDRIQTATAAGTLPDILDVDGPLMSSFAYQGALAPLDDLLAPEVLADTLPSLVAQGTWDDKVYALGTFESGLAMFADARALEAADVRVPTSPRDAWTAAEFDDVLRRLADHDDDRLVLDTKRSYGPGEWSTYGFSPLLYSAGGGLLDPQTGLATGTLDSDASVAAMTHLQRWNSFVDPDADNAAFVDRTVPLSWVGHWEYTRYAEALGDDLVLVPLPDLGHGTRATTGSWAWAVSSSSAHKELGAALLSALHTPEAVLATTAANGAVPGTSTALAQAPAYRDGGPLHLYARQLTEDCGAGSDACVAVQRPRTPVYPVLTASFAQALEQILEGGDPRAALTEAATTVDGEIAVNNGFGGLALGGVPE